MSQHIVFAGGGTTGHVTKNLILMEALKKELPELQMSYLGLKTGKEADLVPGKATFVPISSGKLRRYLDWRTLPDLLKFSWGILQSWWKLGSLKPDLVFSSGGYVALPVALAAWLRRIPVITHETDSYPGLANRIMAKVAQKVFLGYQTAKAYLPVEKTIYTGNPVSPHLFEGSRERALKQLQFDPERTTILAMGGSQGAQQINELMAEILPELIKESQVIHLTGKDNALDFEPQHYRGFEYVKEEYADFLNAADLIISRGGGNSLAEIAALNKAAIVIPLGLPAAAGDHQRKNALEMAEGCENWIVLDQKTPTKEDLLQAVQTLIKISKKGQKRPKNKQKVLETMLNEVKPYLKKGESDGERSS